MKKNSGVLLWEKAKKIIPGGNQLLSKRSEMFLPDQWPSYYSRARGIDVWDMDNRRFKDFSIMGIGSCVLGYSHPAVNRAVVRAVRAGSMNTLNCPEEVELAEKLIELHPWSGMVRFSRSGGEACAIAIRIARAASGKDKVMFCGYHGWTDWYLSSNLADSKNLDGQLLPGLSPDGVPRSLKDTAIPFGYGNIEDFKAKLSQHGAQVGVIIMEVQRSKDIDLPFLQFVRQEASRIGAVLVYDEVTSGFRLRAGGMHQLHSLEPDMVVLGKALGNGHPISAVVGRKEVMQAAQGTFVSSTYWTERVGFAAALAVIKEFKKNDVPRILADRGDYLRTGLKKIFKDSLLKAEVAGLVPAPTLVFQEEDPALIKTLFTQEMLRRGFLASTLIYASTAHTKKACDLYLGAAERVVEVISNAKQTGSLASLLQGPVCHSGFQRLA